MLDFPVPNHQPATVVKVAGDANKPRVLIVDDQILLRKLIFNVLVMEGYSVSEAVNGQECLNKLDRESVDLVLLDLKLPLLGGVDVAERIRNKASTRNLPILIVSGTADRSDVLRLKLLGTNGFLVKPFEIDHLVARVRDAIHAKSSAEKGKQPGEPDRGREQSVRVALASKDDRVFVSRLTPVEQIRTDSELGSDLKMPSGNGILAPAGAKITERLLEKIKALGIDLIPVRAK